MTTATHEMFQLFTADCKGSYLKLLSDCSLYKVKVFRRGEMELQEVDVPDEDACSSSNDTSAGSGPARIRWCNGLHLLNEFSNKG